MQRIEHDLSTGATRVIELTAEEVASLPGPPPITAGQVKAEAQRRIIALVGASDIIGCFVKQLNFNMRANELNDIRHDRALTAEEAAEAAALRNFAAGIKAIRTKSNEIEALSPIPADYADNARWS